MIRFFLFAGILGAFILASSEKAHIASVEVLDDSNCAAVVLKVEIAVHETETDNEDGIVFTVLATSHKGEYLDDFWNQMFVLPGWLEDKTFISYYNQLTVDLTDQPIFIMLSGDEQRLDKLVYKYEPCENVKPTPTRYWETGDDEEDMYYVTPTPMPTPIIDEPEVEIILAPVEPLRVPAGCQLGCLSLVRYR